MSMTTSEKIAYVQALLDDPEATDTLINAYLIKAKADVFARMYPTGNRPAAVTDVPERYEIHQCLLARNAFLRRGGEGEISHSENGITRHYHSANDEEILMEVMQVIRL